MKIHKVISCLLTVSLLTITVSGCVNDKLESEKTDDQKIIVEFSDVTVLEGRFNEDAGNHTYEYEPWDTKFADGYISPSAKKTVTVKFNGVKYTGKYSSSEGYAPNTPYTVHVYKGENCRFTTKADTGELLSFEFSKNPDPGETLDEAKCRQIADEFASKYIDVSGYQVEAKINAKSNKCKFTYGKYIADRETYEALAITVDGNGNIVYFHSRLLHAFDSVVAVEVDEERITAAIDAKLASIYEGVDNYDRYVVKEVTLTRLVDGRFAFVYAVSAKFEKVYTEDGSYIERSTPIWLLVVTSNTRPAE